jgi:selenocysteine lyase/cysteine desulfurase
MNEEPLDQELTDWCLPRRELLKRLASGIAVGAVAPRLLSADELSSNTAIQNEAFWIDIKSRFPIKPDYIMMNAANLCPTHDAVLQQLFGYTNDRESDVSFHNRAKFRETKQKSRDKLAEYLAVNSDEIAITRNTSEGNNIIINGLDLEPGDEVIIWDQNHPSNNLAWKTRAKRSGFTINEISIPMSVESPEQLFEIFNSQFTNKTRVFAASHVSNTSGIGLPIKELSQSCRERGIKTLIDGAQTFGALNLDLHDLGCDYFTGSMHKWPMGPKEAGLLYVRKGMAGDVWPSIISFGYNNIDPDSAAKFESFGQLDDAIVASVTSAIDFHLEIGPTNIENRLYEITDQLKNGIKDIPGSFVLTPDSHSMSAGVVIFSLKNVKGVDGFEQLYKEHQVASAPAQVYQLVSNATETTSGIRLSPHIYNTQSDIEKVLTALKEISA